MGVDNRVSYEIRIDTEADTFSESGHFGPSTLNSAQFSGELGGVMLRSLSRLLVKFRTEVGD